MTTKLHFGRDDQGYNAYAPPFGDDAFQTTLAANSPQSLLVPNNYENWIVIFGYSPGANIWVANNNTATVPGASFTATSSKLNPASRTVKSGDALSFITSDTDSPAVSVVFYAVS